MSSADIVGGVCFAGSGMGDGDVREVSGHGSSGEGVMAISCWREGSFGEVSCGNLTERPLGWPAPRGAVFILGLP